MLKQINQGARELVDIKTNAMILYSQDCEESNFKNIEHKTYKIILYHGTCYPYYYIVTKHTWRFQGRYFSPNPFFSLTPPRPSPTVLKPRALLMPSLHPYVSKEILF